LAKIALILVLISLVGNRLPWLNVMAMLMFLVSYIWFGTDWACERDFVPHSTIRWVKWAYVFWLASYLLTRAPLSNLVSFDFLRRDGALLFAYLPLLVIGNYGLPQAFLQRSVALYLSLISAVGVLGAALYLEALSNLSLSSWVLPQDWQIITTSQLAGNEFHGFFEAHNSAGAIYGLASCLSLALLIFTERFRLWSLPSFWFAASFVGLMLSKSRTAYVAFLATSLIMLVGKMRNWRKVVKVAMFLIAPVVYFALLQPEVSERAGEVTSTDDVNVVERLVYFERAKDDFLASPLIGIGFGRYNDEYLAYSGIRNIFYVATGGEVVNESTHAHNSYLHFLAEGGVLGLVLMMGIWVSAYRWARKMQDRFPLGTFAYAFSIGIQACIIFEFFDSFTEHSMGTAITSLTVFTLFGILRNLAGTGSALDGAIVSVRSFSSPPTRPALT
jgi:O-antigen ligase